MPGDDLLGGEPAARGHFGQVRRKFRGVADRQFDVAYEVVRGGRQHAQAVPDQVGRGVARGGSRHEPCGIEMQRQRTERGNHVADPGHLPAADRLRELLDARIDGEIEGFRKLGQHGRIAERDDARERGGHQVTAGRSVFLAEVP